MLYSSNEEQELICKLESAAEPVIEEIVDNGGKYKSTYTTYSGADIQFYLNNEGIGSVAKIAINHDPGGVSGTITEVFFNHSYFSDYPSGTAKLVFKNEYGQAYEMVLEDFRIENGTFSMGVDDVVLERHYNFSATSLTEGVPNVGTDETNKDGKESS